MISLITILRAVPGPRTGNATRHDLLDVLVIALTASICGCESCVEFADFAWDREELFREFLSLDGASFVLRRKSLIRLESGPTG